MIFVVCFLTENIHKNKPQKLKFYINFSLHFYIQTSVIRNKSCAGGDVRQIYHMPYIKKKVPKNGTFFYKAYKEKSAIKV